MSKGKILHAAMLNARKLPVRDKMITHGVEVFHIGAIRAAKQMRKTLECCFKWMPVQFKSRGLLK